MSGRSTQAKKDYIRWFLKTQKLKREEARELLRFVLRSEELIARIDFVEDVTPYRDALLVSAQGTGTYPFLFRTNGQVIQDVKEAMKLLKGAPPRRLKVWLSFGKTPEVGAVGSDDKTIRLLSRAQQLLGDWAEEYEMRQKMASDIMERIHEALDSGNRDAFMELSSEYQKVKDWLSQVRH